MARPHARKGGQAVLYLGFKDGEGERRLQLDGQVGLCCLVTHEHYLVCPKLNLRVLRVRAKEEHREIVLASVGEQGG